MGRREEDHRENQQQKEFGRNVNGVLIFSQFMRRASMPPEEAQDLATSNALMHTAWRELDPREEVPEHLKQFVDTVNNTVPVHFFGPFPSIQSLDTQIPPQNTNRHKA